MPSRPADLRECGDWWNDTAYATDAAVSVSWGEEYKTITAFQLVAPRYCITGRLLLSVRPRVSCCSMMGKRPGCPWMVLPSDSTDISSNNCSFARKTSHCIRACCCSCLSGCVHRRSVSVRMFGTRTIQKKSGSEVGTGVQDLTCFARFFCL